MAMKPSSQTAEEIFDAVRLHGPISGPDIGKLLQKTPNCISFYLRVLTRATPKRIYISGSRHMGGRGKYARLWSVGDLPDVEVDLTPVHVSYEELEEREDARARREALARNRVHRDEMIFRTCGVAP